MEFDTYEEIKDFMKNSLSLKEIVKDLKITEKFLRNQIVTGKLPAKKINGKYRILKSDIKQFYNRKMGVLIEE